MPCDSGPSADDYAREAHNSRATQLLCGLLRVNGIKEEALTEELKKWYALHKERDRAQIEQREPLTQARIQLDKVIAERLAKINGT